MAKEIISLNTKVDKIVGKGLSTNDYTNEEKNKLNSLGTASQYNVGTAVGNIPVIDETGKIPSVLLPTIDEGDSADAALEAAKAYTDTKVANLVNSAPETLDTLGELATALEENDEVVEALNAAIGNKSDKEHTHTIANVDGLQNSLNTINNKINEISFNYLWDSSNLTHTGTLVTDATANSGSNIELKTTSTNITSGTARTFPFGTYVAIFRLKVSAITSTSTTATLKIGGVSVEIKPSKFSAVNTWEYFKIPFEINSSTTKNISPKITKTSDSVTLNVDSILVAPNVFAIY